MQLLQSIVLKETTSNGINEFTFLQWRVLLLYFRQICVISIFSELDRCWQMALNGTIFLFMIKVLPRYQT